MDAPNVAQTPKPPRFKWKRHYCTLLKKNWILAKRNVTATAIQVFVPFILALLLYGLQFAIQNNQSRSELIAPLPVPEIEHIADIQPCKVGSGYTSCTTMAYTPNNDPVVDAIIANMAAHSGLPSSAFVPYADNAAFNNYMIANPNSTQGAVHFFIRYTSAAAPKTIANLLGVRYALQFDVDTVTLYGTSNDPVIDIHMPMQKAVERAVLQTISSSPGDVDFDYNFQAMAHPEIDPDDVVASVGAIFFFGALMFNSVIQLSQIVMEKQLHLTQTIKMMGVADSAYWCSNITYMLVMNTISVFMLIISGCIFQFQFFLLNDFGTYFFLFLLFAWAMIPVVMLISVLVNEAKTATVLGFAIFLVGLICQIFSAFVFTEDVTWYRVIFSFLPFAVLAKGMADLGEFSNSVSSVGLRWADRSMSAEAFPLTTAYNWLIISFFFYLILALYLSKVVPDSSGAHEAPWFCVLPSFWCPSRCKRSVTRRSPNDFAEMMREQEEEEARAEADAAKAAGGPEPVAMKPLASSSPNAAGQHFADEEEARVARLLEAAKLGSDEAVANEGKRVDEYEADLQRQRASGVTPVETAPVRFVHLGKIFFGRVCCCFPDHKRDFHAVRGLSLLLEKNRLFVLLGHNGAGKSTTFNMMTGVLQPTYGDGVVMGHSIIDDMSGVTQHIGVCPQHDVLWDQLTPIEHLAMFADFKNLPHDKMSAEIAERLEDVQLTKEGNRVAGNFSGGMKRRLSVAISLIGDPSVVYLDEPTTGMDPVSRRSVWDLIQKVKRSRVTVLTTHSMEEADVLGDRIGIMKKGRFIALGTSLMLKNKFGSGYKVSIVCEPLNNVESPGNSPNAGANHRAAQQQQLDSQLDQIESFISARVPSSAVESRAYNSLEVKVPNTASEQMPALLAELEERKATLGIVDIQLSLTTLEEVFLKVGALGGEHDERSNATTDGQGCVKRFCARPWWHKLLIIGIPLIILLIIIGAIARGARSSDDGPVRIPPVVLTAASAMASSSFVNGAWYQIPSTIDNAAGAVCSLGDDFSFFASKATGATAMSHVAMHFQGGFPCSDSRTCSSSKFGQLFADTVEPAYEIVTLRKGLLDHTVNNNPIKDYSHVYIPHCSADAHVGTQLYQYDAGLTIQHFGSKNVELVFQWMTTMFPPAGVTKLVLIGGDAGAVGAAMWASAVRQAYTNAVVTILVDSSQALSGGFPDVVAPYPEASATSTALASFFGASALAWGLSASPAITAFSTDSNAFVAALPATLASNFTVDSVLAAYARGNSPSLTIGRISSTLDQSQGLVLSTAIPALASAPVAAVASAMCKLTVNTATEFRSLGVTNYIDYVSTNAFSDLFASTSLYSAGSAPALALIADAVQNQPPNGTSTDLATIVCP